MTTFDGNLASGSSHIGSGSGNNVVGNGTILPSYITGWQLLFGCKIDHPTLNFGFHVTSLDQNLISIQCLCCDNTFPLFLLNILSLRNRECFPSSWK